MDKIIDYKFKDWCWNCQNYVTIWNQRIIRTFHDCALNHGIVLGKCEMVFGKTKPSMYKKQSNIEN